jgi:hypothetical protein
MSCRTIVYLELLHEAHLCVKPLNEEHKREHILKSEQDICLRDQPPLRVREMDLIAIWRRNYGQSSVHVRHGGARWANNKWMNNMRVTLAPAGSPTGESMSIWLLLRLLP